MKVDQLMDVKIPDFTKGHVLIVGDIMLDRYWHGQTQRISPEAPVPIVQIQNVEERPGGAGNVALNIRHLGTHTTLVGIVGEDEAGIVLENKFKSVNINVHLLKYASHPTIIKLRVVSQNQQLVRLDFEKPLITADPTPFYEQVEKHLTYCSVLVLSDYGKGTLHDPQAFIKLAKNHNPTIKILIDPKGKDFSRYNNATLLTPNRKEFEIVVGPCKDDADLTEKGLNALQAHNLEAILVTRGSEGMTLITRDHPPLHLPAHTREIYDVTGAGDTVIGVLAACLALDHPLPESANLANLAAGIVVGKAGAAAVSVPELRRKLHIHQGTVTGVMNREQLLIAVKDARAHGERIVMTNGCFDILHAGHVKYLNEAKALGDRLIIAVNDDASVSRLKGAGRPINTLNRRMAVLTALESVDWVTPFGEDTPAELIEEILPDILVKGGDYQIDKIAGAAAVTANGGHVKILSFEEGLSTTNVVTQLKTIEQDVKV